MDTENARALNIQIRRVAELLPGGLEHEYGFSCECGCGEMVEITAFELDRQSGAWLSGHRALHQPDRRVESAVGSAALSGCRVRG